MQMLQEKIEENFFWEIKGKVEYYYYYAFLIYLRYLANRSVIRHFHPNISKMLWGGGL